MPKYEEIKNEFKEIAEILKFYPEILQQKVFDILTSHYLQIDVNTFGEKSEDTIDSENISNKFVVEKEQPKQQVKTVRRKTNNKESYQIVKDINLREDGKIPFKDFVESKQPKSGIEFNVVSIYYLSKIMEVDLITIDHIYTCYKEVNKKVPDRLKQSLFDTSGSKYGYINIKDNMYSLPTRGENLVEHELPKPIKGAK